MYQPHQYGDVAAAVGVRPAGTGESLRVVVSFCVVYYLRATCCSYTALYTPVFVGHGVFFAVARFLNWAPRMTRTFLVCGCVYCGVVNASCVCCVGVCVCNVCMCVHGTHRRAMAWGVPLCTLPSPTSSSWPATTVPAQSFSRGKLPRYRSHTFVVSH